MIHFENALPSSEEMALMDLRTMESGVSSLTLMERAGRATAKIISERYLQSEQQSKTLILCGPGNNGGDGLVVARLLAEAGHPVTVIVCQAARYSTDFLENYNRLKRTSAVIYAFPEEPDSGSIRASHIEENALRRLLREYAVVVDAILGTGQTGAPMGAIGELVSIVSEERELYRNILVSVDIPTGVNATTGEVFGNVINADLTVCIQCVKRGIVQYPARHFCGEIAVVDIGIATRGGSLFRLFEKSALDFPRRRLDSHKGDFSKVLIAAGSKHFPGAAVLAAHAALRSGAPLVTTLTGSWSDSQNFLPEIMRLHVSEKGGVLGKISYKDVKSHLRDFGVIVVGPGLSISNETRAFVQSLIVDTRKTGAQVVIDADGLNLLAGDIVQGDRDLSHCILTPHPGEAARLLERSTEDVQNDRYASAIDLHERTGAVVVLKGASSIIFGPAGGIVNHSGNPYMATGGSGDVLAGIIGGLLAQGLGLIDAAQWGTYLHGCAGDKAHSRQYGPIIASDIIAELPSVIGEVLSG